MLAPPRATGTGARLRKCSSRRLKSRRAGRRRGSRSAKRSSICVILPAQRKNLRSACGSILRMRRGLSCASWRLAPLSPRPARGLCGAAVRRLRATFQRAPGPRTLLSRPRTGRRGARRRRARAKIPAYARHGLRFRPSRRGAESAVQGPRRGRHFAEDDCRSRPHKTLQRAQGRRLLGLSRGAIGGRSRPCRRRRRLCLRRRPRARVRSDRARWRATAFWRSRSKASPARLLGSARRCAFAIPAPTSSARSPRRSWTSCCCATLGREKKPTRPPPASSRSLGPQDRRVELAAEHEDRRDEIEKHQRDHHLGEPGIGVDVVARVLA